jgi:phage shock protein PspC (stress-responsive transcriptional regulator)
MNNLHESFRRHGLTRPRDGRVLAGVCAGLARRAGIDPWPARLLFVLMALLVLHGGLLLLYVILWILMPEDETAPAAVWPSEPPVSPSR